MQNTTEAMLTIYSLDISISSTELMDHSSGVHGMQSLDAQPPMQTRKQHRIPVFALSPATRNGP
jgi:hypothetical protein